MAIDYSVFEFAKSRNKTLEKAEARAELDKQDKKENAKAKQRAKGGCEVIVSLMAPIKGDVTLAHSERCTRKDTETHHLIGGIGRRNKGKSLLADYKLRVCKECHDAITKHILRPTTAVHDAHTVRYWRER